MLQGFMSGAGNVTRTRDLRITNTEFYEFVKFHNVSFSPVTSILSALLPFTSFRQM